MAQTNAARDFVRDLKPQMEVIRNIQAELHQNRGQLSALHGAQFVGEKLQELAGAVEELMDAIAKALETKAS